MTLHDHDNHLAVPLPRNDATKKQISHQIILVNLFQALKLRNTALTREVFVQQHEAVVRIVISSSRDPLVMMMILVSYVNPKP